MKIEQCRWIDGQGWQPHEPGEGDGTAHLVFIFGGTSRFKSPDLFRELSSAFPKAHIIGCTTAGEICGTEVTDDSLVCTAVTFDEISCEGARVHVDEAGGSHEAGEELGRLLPHEGLKHVFVLSDGLLVNGTELVRGMVKALPADVTVTGGLSGDGDAFGTTYVLWDDKAETGSVVAVGLYGDRCHVGYGSLGGWDSFGPERLVTKSVGNELFQLEGTSALALYKNYLGEHAAGLPATGLLFPLAIRMPDSESSIVRTILSIDEDKESLTFAGDIPEGAYARLMKANFNRLIDGAVGAAHNSCDTLGLQDPDLALLISCVGRRMVLKQRVEEEVEGVREVLGQNAILTGFYSYGEISPLLPSAKCELHNQTMTITTISER